MTEGRFYMSDKIIVMTTTGSGDEARRIADALVERRQAACVNILKGVESIYRWKGKTEEAQEWMLLIKTTSDVYDAVCATLKELHSYEMPECISITIDNGRPDYMHWIEDAIQQKAKV